MKKTILKSFILLLSIFSVFSAVVKTSDIAKLVNANQDTSVSITAKAAYVKDFDSGTELFAYNGNVRLPIASMAKIMTLLLCYEHIDSGALTMNDSITVSENASSMGGSQAFLDANKQYKVSDLMKTIVITSANDSCVAMAEHISGSVETFVADMNQKALSLKMENTKFANCTGLPAPDSYSCAKDVATMMTELVKHKDYFLHSKIWMDKLVHHDGRETELTNTNKLSRFYDGCDAGKTGYTSEAGHCLSASAKRNDMRLISVVIGASDSKVRFAEISKLFNWGFANYENKLIVDCKNNLEKTLPVKRGKKAEVLARAKENIAIFKARKEELKDIKVCQENYKIKAPIKIGDVVGKITVMYDGQPFKSVDIIASEKVDKKGYKDIIKDMFDYWHFK